MTAIQRGDGVSMQALSVAVQSHLQGMAVPSHGYSVPGHCLSRGDNTFVWRVYGGAVTAPSLVSKDSRSQCLSPWNSRAAAFVHCFPLGALGF